MATDPTNHARRWVDHAAQDALNRLGKAMKRGTGCHLTAEMVAALDLTIIGEICASEDPRLAVRTELERLSHEQ